MKARVEGYSQYYHRRAHLHIGAGFLPGPDMRPNTQEHATTVNGDVSPTVPDLDQ